LITSTASAEPAFTASTARCRANVAAEQATSMSNPKPSMPSWCWVSMAMAG
jgi:hypothetical protein